MQALLKRAFLGLALALPGAVASAAAPAPTPATPPAPTADVMPAHESFSLDSVPLKETRRIVVYLPPGYAGRTSARYPVLYMPDGGVQEDFPHVAATVDAGIRAGELKPMLVVGIENTERRRDMTAPTTVESDRKIAPRVGGSAAFRAFLNTELVPWVEARYRTNGERALIGESLAGLFVLETCLAADSPFGTCIALSPSLWWNDHALLRAAPVQLAAQPPRRWRLWFASADETDIAPFAAQLDAELRKLAPAGLEWQYQPHPELRHGNIYRSLAPAYLRGLFAP